ncbi:SGNH/GDSL hydrolase family protein [Geminicoccus roseus]|uniref:SGNH/GDSL hydrolase family protein n=1 Tax=Geminicoccus roseus TaxID=404900 RepID=UPI000688E0D6|nr:SGNH/GDSL hydrolase family protein [Geminicoccus roseus]
MLAAGSAAAADAKRVMVFGDSNSWGWIPITEGFPSTRYAQDERWPGVLQEQLGEGYEVVVEALSGRTTDLADPTVPNVTGAALVGADYLSPAIASHLPLDLVVIMLGTNDLKAMYDRSPYRIALGMGKLVDIVQDTGGGVGTSYPAPKVLVLAPPPLGELSPQAFQDLFAGGPEKSRRLGELYEPVARAGGAEFLDIGQVTPTDGVDGIHFTKEAQRKIGMAVADKVKAIFE